MVGNYLRLFTEQEEEEEEEEEEEVYSRNLILNH